MSKQNLNSLTSLFAGKTSEPKDVKSGNSVDATSGPVICGDLDIRIDRDAHWFYHGTPIGRKELVKLFSSVLQRDDDGSYWLVTPVEKGRILVEDVPFAAVEMDVDGTGQEQKISFRTNVDEIVIAGKANPIRVDIDSETKEPSPYVLVRDGLEARLTRSVYYELVELGVEEEVDGALKYGIWSGGEFFVIGSLDEADDKSAGDAC